MSQIQSLVPLLSAAADAPPAGGAAIGQIVIATVAATIVTAVLMHLVIAHRQGRTRLLDRAGAVAEEVTGSPSWASLPISILTGALIVAVIGMMWDISLHIGMGRDEGPLANPAHYLILAGLFGIMAAGIISMFMPTDRPSDSAVKLAEGWYAPLGGILITACGAFALAGFPLDDVWHRLFGQDVTLWGPTHLMLIGGAAMTIVGMAVLTAEGRRAGQAGYRETSKRRLAAAGETGPVRIGPLRLTGDAGDSQTREEAAASGRAPGFHFGPIRISAGASEWIQRVLLGGAFLAGLSTFQAEFDFGVPQFRMVFGPMLVMLAAGAGLVAIRIWAGRGAALGAVAFFIGIRASLAVLVGPILGEPMPHFHPYLAEAILVELVALAIAPAARPLAFALASGAALGTVGLAAEWAWSHLWMPLPWSASMFPEGAILGAAMAMAGCLIGAWIGARLSAPRIRRDRALKLAGAGAAAVVLALVGYGLYTPNDREISAQLVLDRTPPADLSEPSAVGARVELIPRSAGDEVEWLTSTSWQGGDLVVDRLREVEPGVYETRGEVPIGGNWKTMIRLHAGNDLLGLPVFLPADPAIPAPAVIPEPRSTRAFVADRELLQRESKIDGGLLPALAYSAVLAMALAFLGLVAWGVHRLAVASERRAGGGGPLDGSAGTAGSRPRRLLRGQLAALRSALF